MSYYGDFKEEKFYFRPSYGKIEYNGKYFHLIKSREKKEDFYPISSLHNPLKPRLRFLNLYNKYYKQNNKHLNIGLGIGDYELFLSRLPVKLYSIEHPKDLVLKENITQKNIAVSKTLISTVDICESALPFEDNFFDSVSLLEVFEHLPPEKLSFAILEITRVLKSNGYLYLSTPNLASLENRLLLMFKGKLFLSLPQKGEVIFGHLRTYTASEIKNFFLSFGYETLEQVFFTDNITYKAKDNLFHIIQARLIKLLVRFNKNFNNSMMFVMRKF
ncbi:MAG: methyltransferase domain-containing protein [Candidatus Omnitrophota bacterium]|nr:methyltransferase domain-containing protein [Candidatus Omnitrophota bacterium]